MGKKKEKKLMKSFFEACNFGQLPIIKQLLTEHPELIAYQDEKRYCALHIAVLGGQLSSVVMLLNWGADPNSLTDDLKTPLYLAVRNGYLEITEKLIERGAEPWRKTYTSKTALHAAMEVIPNDEETAIKMIKTLLYKKKYRPDVFKQFVDTQDSRCLTALEFAKKHFPAKTHIISMLENITPPAEEHEISILLHGWNDKLNDWKEIEDNFTKEVGTPFYLFAYDSLANRVSIGTLAEDLHIFIGEKLEQYRKSKVQSFSRRTDLKEIPIGVNIICYSTGGLIVRQFLQNHYRTKFRAVIDRVVFLAPANMGSPFAKFGKSSVGRIYTGQKKVGSLFECGEELLTSLEPNSPFIWDLAHGDVFEKEENQYFVPSEIMATIIQGTKHYPKNLQTKVTRGDMRGTDGTVTISGASLRAVKYSMNLAGGDKGKEILVEKSTSDTALRLHPAHTHRSLIDSLVLKTDVFFLVRRALETTREQFKSLQQSFADENEIHYSSSHTPGNLLIFQYNGQHHPSIVPQVLVHPKTFTPGFGQRVDFNKMKLETRASLIGKIRVQFDYTEYHSRSRNMFYKIADLVLISKCLLSICAAHPGCDISLGLSLKGQSEFGRVFASTAWIDTFGDCFYCSDMGTTSLFTIAPVLQDMTGEATDAAFEEAPELDKTDNSTFAQKALRKDDCLDETLCSLGTPGIIHLCSLFHRDKMMDDFLRLVGKEKIEELSGNTRAHVIRALVPFFNVTTEVQEACANLIITINSSEMTAFKREMDTEHNEVQSIYDNLPLPTQCKSLHQLIFTLFTKVPFRFLKFGHNATKLAKYLSQGTDGSACGVWFINLGVLLAENIFKTSDEIELEKPMKYLVFVEDTLQGVTDPRFTEGEMIYPGASTFLTKLSEGDNMDVILIKSADYQKEILLDGVSHIVLSYPNNYCIRQFIVEYLSLYPEYFYSIICNNTPHILNAVLDLFKTYEGAWVLFLDTKDIASPDFVNLEANEYNFSVCTTWVDGALCAYEQDLLESLDVIACARACMEELQFGIMRKYIRCPTDRYEEIIESAEQVKKMVVALPDGTEKQTCWSSAADLYRAAREHYVSLLLSDIGIDMILKFKKWMDDQKEPKGTLAEGKHRSEIFIDMSKDDPQKCFELNHLLKPKEEIAPKIISKKVFERGTSTASMLLSGERRPSFASSPTRKRTLVSSTPNMTSPREEIPSYLKGLDSQPTPNQYTSNLMPEVTTNPTTSFANRPSPSRRAAPKRKSVIGTKGKPLPMLPPE